MLQHNVVCSKVQRAVFVDRREYTGPLWEQIDEAFQFVLRNIHLGATIVGIYRQDIYEIPPDAIRELIINAMVHRSYLDHGTIQVAVYDNQLEITSPGKLPMGQTMERMKEGYSKIRNEALAHAFAYMNLIEHWGSGIPRIIDKVKASGLREPEFYQRRIIFWYENKEFEDKLYEGVLENTKVIALTFLLIFASYKKLMRTCYMQACLAYVNFEGISNSDIRKIFGLGEKERAKASRLLTSAVEGGYIKVMDPDTAPRYKKYIPYWA